jgi:hypothetical protein
VSGAFWIAVMVGSFVGTLIGRWVSDRVRAFLLGSLVPVHGRFRVETRARLEHYIVDQAGTVLEGPIDNERAADNLRKLFEMAYGERRA